MDTICVCILVYMYISVSVFQDINLEIKNTHTNQPHGPLDAVSTSSSKHPIYCKELSFREGYQNKSFNVRLIQTSTYLYTRESVDLSQLCN